jgi:hypothetical protein
MEKAARFFHICSNNYHKISFFSLDIFFYGSILIDETEELFCLETGPWGMGKSGQGTENTVMERV